MIIKIIKKIVKNTLKNLAKIINFFNIFNIKVLNLSKKIFRIPFLKHDFGLILSIFLKRNYLSHVVRPKYAKDVDQISTNTNFDNKVGIILQGPIGDRNFLIETIGLYSKIFPNCHVVLSTWKDEDVKNIDKYNKNLHIIQSNYPSEPGYFSKKINYQLKSTSAGINFLKTLNVDYIIKSRTDCRIYKPNTIPYLLSLFKNFPKKNNGDSSRIFATGIGTSKYKVYGLADLFQFGRTRDLELYFKFEDEKTIMANYGFNNKKIIKGTALVNPSLLCARYLRNLNIELKWSLDHWWECLRDHFGIIDADSIDLLWLKHSWEFEKRLVRNYNFKASRAVEFSDWLSLYTHNKMDWEKTGYHEQFEEREGEIHHLKVF